MTARLIIAIAAGLLAGPALAQTELDGAAQFEAHCSACHNVGGTGTPGLAPPLDRPEFWQALGDNATKYVSGVVTKGFTQGITVRGETYAGMIMPPVAGTPDDELAAAATYVVGTLGQTDHKVSAQDITAARDSMSPDDIKAMRPASE